jgi:hypothetical protein
MRVILILLFLVSQAHALTVVTRYVRTDCANNGDGTASSCAASPGAAGAYTTLANAESDIQTDYANFVSSDVQVDVDCAGTAADGGLTIDGMTMDATRYLRIFTTQANRHDGKWNTSKFRVSSSGTTIIVHDQYVRLDGLQIESTGTGSGWYASIYNSANSGGLSLHVTNSILRGAACNTGGGGECWLVYFKPNVSNTRIYFANNIGYAPTSNFKRLFGLEGSDNCCSGLLIAAYNNTGYGGDYGFSFNANGTSDALYLKNNVIQSTATADYTISDTFSTYTNSNNMSEDTSSPNNTYDSLTCSYVNTTFATADYHLQSGDTNCQDDGADLSGDAQYAFSTDIDGATRTGTWDIGADEYSNSTNFFAVLNAMGEL